MPRLILTAMHGIFTNYIEIQIIIYVTLKNKIHARISNVLYIT